MLVSTKDKDKVEAFLKKKRYDEKEIALHNAKMEQIKLLQQFFQTNENKNIRQG